MTRAALVYLMALTACISVVWAQTYLTPLDFGLKPLPHGRIDYTHTPPNILVGQFNSDFYPDIARFEGEKLEIYLLEAGGYPARPQLQRHFRKAIKSLRLDGIPWDTRQNLVVTLQDGSEETFAQGPGLLDLREYDGFLPVSSGHFGPPRQVCDFDFQLVWQSDPKPYGMDRVAAGDLDDDGINELVTWWKDSLYADTAYILIYKSTGDNQYELFMNEPFFTEEGSTPGLTALMITDLDSNGQKELMFTLGYCHFWEFSAPGIYTEWRSDFMFPRAVQDITTSNVDVDGRPEIAAVTGNYGMTPPCYYYVEEYQAKNTADSIFMFTLIAEFSQEWLDCRLAVGDFDNDGVCDIVSGWPGYLTGWEATWVQYFRYSLYSPNHFVQHWLIPGIYATCGTPAIKDFDRDGQEELYSAGFGGYSSGSNGGGSAYIWEGLSLDSGYVAWWDTTTMIYGPSVVDMGYVDSILCILNNVIFLIDGYFYLFGYENNQYQCLWQTGEFDSLSFTWTPFCDMDQDGKMNFVTGQHIGDFTVPDNVTDWEQTSTGMEMLPVSAPPSTFALYPNIPNPFNKATRIPFELALPSDVELAIFDISGRKILNWQWKNLSAGKHDFIWQPGNLSSGIYLIRLSTAAQKQIKKAVLLK
jgi:hypothetical protein